MNLLLCNDSNCSRCWSLNCWICLITDYRHKVVVQSFNGLNHPLKDYVTNNLHYRIQSHTPNPLPHALSHPHISATHKVTHAINAVFIIFLTELSPNWTQLPEFTGKLLGDLERSKQKWNLNGGREKRNVFRKQTRVRSKNISIVKLLEHDYLIVSLYHF